MARSKASRKYLITFNNPLEHGFDHDTIKRNLSEMTGCLYWCMSDEIGNKEGTHHTHLYAAFQNAKEFSTIQRRFYGAHADFARGTHQQNRDYIRKEGKWKDDPKHDTNLPGTFEESGDLPEEPDKRAKQSEAILAMLEGGASNAEILRAYPSAMNHLPRIDQARQTILEEKYRKEFRDLQVFYIHGKTRVGKTRSVMEKYGYENVYRVTDYAHPFDSYAGQDVLLLDEFRSSLPFTQMLNILDGYPLKLPCRYTDRQACYTKVFIISNIPLNKQYTDIQYEDPEGYQAFLARIKARYEMLPPAGSNEPF